MKFDKVDIDADYAFKVDKEKFRAFLKEFHIDGVHWDEPTSIHPAYFLRLLVTGTIARERHKTEGFTNILYQEYYSSLLDHCALWKTREGGVFCTAMPYGKLSTVESAFKDMKERFGYPDAIKMALLGDSYRYRNNGDYMIAIYGPSAREVFERDGWMPPV